MTEGDWHKCRRPPTADRRPTALPYLLRAEEIASLPWISRKAVYCMVDHGELAGLTEIGHLDTISAMNNGVPVLGPNEARMPDPWGSPIFFYPDSADESYVPQNLNGGAALDLCGAHTGNSAHDHGVNEACFELAPDNKPANSYVAATENWAFEPALVDDCIEVSDVAGWSMDGHPIKGPCVCIARDDQGVHGHPSRA